MSRARARVSSTRLLQRLDLVQRRSRVPVPALELVDDQEQRLHNRDPIRHSSEL